MRAFNWRNILIFCLYRTAFILAIEMSIACTIALFAGYYFALFLHLSNVEIDALWCVISTILVLQATSKESIQGALIRIIGSFIGAVVAALMLSLEINFWRFFLACFVIVVVCACLKLEKYVRLALITAAVILVVHYLSNVSDHYLLTCFARFIESVIGTFSALIVVLAFKSLRIKLKQAYHKIETTKPQQAS